MSYCRFTEGGVYAYVCDGGVQFYVSDGKRELDRLCNTFNEAYQYAKALRDTHGLDVPSNAIEALKADALEEAARICGPDSAVAELEAENAKLRDQLEEQKCFAADLERDVRALRELIRHMHCCSNNEYTEYGIDFIAAHCKDCEYGNDFGHCNFERRMAELGIEVGE